MPWRTLCGFPPTSEPITLRLPFKQWRPDTVITDSEGNEIFVLLDQQQEMRSYEAIFGDLDGRRLCCVKRHLQAQFWKDGYYICTYVPNYPGQRALADRDVDNKRVYPFSYLQVNPMKGRFYYRMFDNREGLGPPKFKAENPWLGFMVVCATPAVRTGRWTIKFKRAHNLHSTAIHVDQWKNRSIIGPGVDLLAALCISYIFDRYQCQPLITVLGRDPEDELEYIDDEHTIDTAEQDDDQEKKKKKEKKQPYTDFQREIEDGDDDDDDDEENNNNKKKSKSKRDDNDPFAIDSDDDEDADTFAQSRASTHETGHSSRFPNNKKNPNSYLDDDETASRATQNYLYDTSWLKEDDQKVPATTSASNKKDPYSNEWLQDEFDNTSKKQQQPFGSTFDDRSISNTSRNNQPPNNTTAALNHLNSQQHPNVPTDSVSVGGFTIDSYHPTGTNVQQQSYPRQPQTTNDHTTAALNHINSQQQQPANTRNAPVDAYSVGGFTIDSYHPYPTQQK